MAGADISSADGTPGEVDIHRGLVWQQRYHAAATPHQRQRRQMRIDHRSRRRSSLTNHSNPAVVRQRHGTQAVMIFLANNPMTTLKDAHRAEKGWWLSSKGRPATVRLRPANSGFFASLRMTFVGQETHFSFATFRRVSARCRASSARV